MKSIALIIALLYACPYWIEAQSACHDYNRLMEEANQAESQQDFEKAIHKYESARTCDPSKGLIVSGKIIAVFKQINGLKEKAIEQKKIAENKSKEATRLQLLAEKAGKDVLMAKYLADNYAETALEQAKELKIANDSMILLIKKVTKQDGLIRQENIKTNKALEKANKKNEEFKLIINKTKRVNEFVFNGQKLALVQNNDKKFGFIDEEGNEKIEFKYDKAEGFNENGYAHVEIAAKGFLIDSSGNEYSLSNDWRKKDTSIKAIELISRGEKSLKELKLELFPNLKILILKGIQLNSLPKGIENLQNLEVLDLSNNLLEKLPDNFYKLKNLKKLYLHNNKLRELPPSIYQLINLEEVDLNNNKIQNLNLEKGKWVKLTKLMLSRNQLVNLPIEMGQLIKLKYLNVGSNVIKPLPNNMGELTELKTLDLSDNTVVELPSNFGHLQNLVDLNLSNNQLAVLPTSFAQLKTLEKLNLNFNSFTQYPLSIDNLTELKELQLNYNPIGKISENIAQLVQLQTLNLEGIGLTKFPKPIFNLKNLSTLNLNYNNLDSIPDEMNYLSNLNGISLIGNKLKYAPEKLIQIAQNADFYLERARIHFASKKYQQAYEASKKSTETDSLFYRYQWNLSWYALFIKKYDEAIIAANQSLKLDKRQTGVITNLALGYLLNNKYIEAEKIYKEWKDKKFYDDDRYAKDVFLQDLDDLEREGITHPDFNKIRQLLTSEN